MDTAKLKKFAQFARRSLLKQVGAKLKVVLAQDSAARRENPDAMTVLEKAIQAEGAEQVVEQVAYTWFNRFCALRFMDVNRYTRVGVVSPAPGQFQPELLAEAKMGLIDGELVKDQIREHIFALLSGGSPSGDPQGEAYRLLVVGACNHWHRTMPFLFQRIDDYTELLMPDDLLSGNAILAYTREAMTPDACRDVEVIGWLYQFYISEKKDEVFAGLKKKRKISPENIPAATQLFTPHWIVRYLVENSLGRLWMLNRPHSRLVEQMDYYIKPEEPETDFLRVGSVEEIKICDPACGSGHMLTYAFDLLYAIYEEEGYTQSAIPEEILTKNLFGVEIDKRAGELAAFALTMKAREKQRHLFRKTVQPNICVLENVTFSERELDEYMDHVGRDLFTMPLQTTLQQFEEANNFGSLIRPNLTDVAPMLKLLETRKVAEQLFLSKTHRTVLKVLAQADYLSPKYHVVIANPPYMGNRNMNSVLSRWVKDAYPDSKLDLFAMFIERCLKLATPRGSVAMITMHSWMFLSSFERLRLHLFKQATILSMAHLGERAFDTIGGAVVSTTSFVLKKACQSQQIGTYIRLTDGVTEAEKSVAALAAIRAPDCEWFYRASSDDFTKIPGWPITYWTSPQIRQLFASEESLENFADARAGLQTSDNDRFMRKWQEVNFCSIGWDCESRGASVASGCRWFPCNKGGPFRKWYGNWDYLVNWENDGQELFEFATGLYGNPTRIIKNADYYFRSGITWSDITTGTTAFRFAPTGAIFDATGHCAFFDSEPEESAYLGYLNTKVIGILTRLLNPTIHFHVGYFRLLPAMSRNLKLHGAIADQCISLSRSDWNAYETSWDFTSLPILQLEYRKPTLQATYDTIRAHWQQMTLEMQRLEEENNRIFIDAYGLQDELTPEVPLREITLTCNPHHRYSGDKSEEALEELLLADTMRELISYAVGCMFGRYALEEPGLILANQGESLQDYLKRVPDPSFPADEDNVLPILDGEWFTDDIVERFRRFLRVAFGKEHDKENLAFIEESLGKKGKARDLRDYFLKDFYNDHVKRYKKRPIYWLFSSPKGSFNALIYLHRYRADTVSVVLNDYLRELRTKLSAHRSHLETVSISARASQGEKTRALKELDRINKMLDELDEYDREVLHPLAIEQVALDLDDGVKANYPKLGAALKKIPGLS